MFFPIMKNKTHLKALLLYHLVALFEQHFPDHLSKESVIHWLHNELSFHLHENVYLQQPSSTPRWLLPIRGSDEDPDIVLSNLDLKPGKKVNQ